MTFTRYCRLRTILFLDFLLLWCKTKLRYSSVNVGLRQRDILNPCSDRDISTSINASFSLSISLSILNYIDAFFLCTWSSIISLVDLSASRRRETQTTICQMSVSSVEVDNFPTACMRDLRGIFAQAYPLGKPHVKNRPCTTSCLVPRSRIKAESIESIRGWGFSSKEMLLPQYLFRAGDCPLL